MPEPRLLSVAAELGGDHDIELVQADALDTGLPPDSFDLVHERTLLLNLTDPAPAVAEMVRLARPGGIVALQEPDAAAWLCDPPHPAFDRLKQQLLAVYERVGRDFHTGRRVGRLLRDAGLRDVDVRATARLTAPGDYYHTFLLVLCGLLGVSAQHERDVAAVCEHLGREGTLTRQPLLWQAYGVKGCGRPTASRDETGTRPFAAPSRAHRPRSSAAAGRW